METDDEKRLGNMVFYLMPNLRTVVAMVVLADGEYPETGVAGALLRSAQRVVCCDGAADGYIAHGAIPMAIVGDCDSLSEANRERFASILHASADQQTNDQTKAVEYCIEHGYNEITILGATGKREDHTIGNISLLADYMSRCNVSMVTDYGVFTPINSDTQFQSHVGQQISVFSFDGSTQIIYEGLQYALAADRASSWWQGTLNCSLGESFKVRTNGKLIVYRAF